MKVAIVCDWLTNVGGAEKVLLEFHKLYKDAPIYTSKYNKKGIDWFNDADVRTGWLQIFPSCLRRFLGPLRQSYFNHLDLSDYDMIISVTGAEAKSVKKGKAVHFCYCHVPTQYYWGMYDDYVKNPGFGILNPLVRACFKLFVRPLRKADFKAAQKPDYFITISKHAQEQIKKYYERDAIIINPPVEISDFKIEKGKCQIIEKNKSTKSQEAEIAKQQNKTSKSQEQAFSQAVENLDLAKTYIVTSRQVNWKRLDLAVQACVKTQRKLVVIGEGPEHKKLVKLAKDAPWIHFLPLMKKSELKTYLSAAKGYIFPSLEPFGIAPVEALAAGCPVIAYREGGARDYVINKQNGLMFTEQTVDSLVSALDQFETMTFDRQKVSNSVDYFSVDRFDEEATKFIADNVKRIAK